MGRDVLEAKYSRSIDVVRSMINLGNKLWEHLKEKLLDQVFVVGASLRLGSMMRRIRNDWRS
ncbi:hypothetical protein A2U01_0085276, partial [Trifolium medium]|nr:hypothetical protein [Trifolium medium]